MMTANNLKQLYFDWIIAKLGGDSRGYYNLLSLLFDTEFEFILIMDGNRYHDGLSLRYQFCIETDISEDNLANCLSSECSVLEMLAALALRTEQDVMFNTRFGDRTSIWFWDMIESLGLLAYDDAHFYGRELDIRKILSRFMRRQYYPNGRGGIVTLENSPCDLCLVDIWTQMMWKLNEYIAIYGG